MMWISEKHMANNKGDFTVQNNVVYDLEGIGMSQLNVPYLKKTVDVLLASFSD